MANNQIREQIIPLSLTLVVLLCLSALLWLTIKTLNLLPAAGDISPVLHFSDVLVGAVIYLKTSVDFAIFTGNLMHTNPGWKKRIAIELGTAIGNGFGTFLILIIWTVFKAIPPLMIIMIFIASVVLLRMAQESFE